MPSCSSATSSGRFALRHPGVEMTVLCHPSIEVAERVAEGELDVGVVTASGDIPGAEVLREEPLVWVAGLRAGAIEERRPLPLALSTASCPWRTVALSALAEAGVPWRLFMTSTHYSAIAPVVRAGQAVTVLPLAVVDPSRISAPSARRPACRRCPPSAWGCCAGPAAARPSPRRWPTRCGPASARARRPCATPPEAAAAARRRRRSRERISWPDLRCAPDPTCDNAAPRRMGHPVSHRRGDAAWPTTPRASASWPARRRCGPAGGFDPARAFRPAGRGRSSTATTELSGPVAEALSVSAVAMAAPTARNSRHRALRLGTGRHRRGRAAPRGARGKSVVPPWTTVNPTHE